MLTGDLQNHQQEEEVHHYGDHRLGDHLRLELGREAMEYELLPLLIIIEAL